MTARRHTCRVVQLPDPAYPLYRLRAGGDVPGAIGAAAEHLLRALAQFPPDSAAVSVRLDYRPRPASGGRQDRLALSVSAEAHDPHVAAALGVLVRKCPLWRFYAPQWHGDDHQGRPRQGPGACVEMARRQMALPATEFTVAKRCSMGRK